MKVFPEAIGVEIPRDNATAIGDMNFNAISPANGRTLDAKHLVMHVYSEVGCS